jgi:Flp pilus assembly protein TadD
MKKKQRKKISLEASAAPASTAAVPVPQESPSAVLVRLLVGFVVVVLLAGGAQFRNRIYQSPVTLWKDASSKSVNKRRTHENYGQALSTAGAYTDAIREFKTVLALKDDGSVPMRDLYREIGVVYFRVGLIDDSIKAWQTGLNFAPMDPSLLNNLSVAYLRQQRFDDAERSIRQALMGAPNMPQALNSLGEILMVKGNYQEALSYFLKAIEVSPEGASRYWNAALASEKTGRLDMTLDFANRYVQMETNPRLRERGLQYLARLRSLYPAK